MFFLKESRQQEEIKSLRYCNGSNDCGNGSTFNKEKNKQVHGQNQVRDDNNGSCSS